MKSWHLSGSDYILSPILFLFAIENMICKTGPRFNFLWKQHFTCHFCVFYQVHKPYTKLQKSCMNSLLTRQPLTGFMTSLHKCQSNNLLIIIKFHIWVVFEAYFEIIINVQHVYKFAFLTPKYFIFCKSEKNSRAFQKLIVYCVPCSIPNKDKTGMYYLIYFQKSD